MKKHQMVKALRDAGVSEDKIKLFMVDAKDDDEGDLKAYTALLLSANDIDVGALIPGIVAELKPALEEMVQGEEFKSLLSKEIAATMVGSGPQTPDGGDADPEEEEAMTSEQMDSKIKDDAQKRIVLIDSARPFLIDNKDFDIFKATDREIIEEALIAVGVEKESMADKSDDYLLGLLDNISTDRKESLQFMNKDWSKGAGESLTAPLTGITARKALKA